MIFNPANLKNKEGSFIFSGNVNATAHVSLNKDIIKEFWRNFAFQCSALDVTETDEFIFSVGDAKALPLDGYDYSINIEKSGVCVYAENETNLVRGFISLLDRFKAIDYNDDIAVEVTCAEIKDKPQIQNRMVHYCIFPQTELRELKRFIRFCAALKFTHIVLEFWGMLKYECLSELSWSHAFDKDQIRPLIREANALGLEIIPMINHWGHASSGRVMQGKHVALDQNPKLQTYFSDDGWCWDIKKPKVRKLLKQVRDELIELCGEGSYFHIGCDEAYNFELTKENLDLICEFINEISDEMVAKNRRIILWGDMFVHRNPEFNPKNKYTCNAPTKEIEQYLLDHLSHDVIIADWQYNPSEAPVETAEVFTRNGFDCMLCPWDKGLDPMKANISTVKDQSLMGIMHTTWHTLSSGFMYTTWASLGCLGDITKYTPRQVRAESNALLRKVLPAYGVYADAGWSKYEVLYRW